MADINIQRKKSSPSPWLLILVVLVVLGGIAWYVLRHDTAPQPETPAGRSVVVEQYANPDSSNIGAETGPRPDGEAVATIASEYAAPATPEVLAAFARTDATQPSYAREGLRLLTSVLVGLADQDNLRDPNVQEKRDNLTSATARLDDSTASLRPGFVAAAALMQAMQQKAYPTQERPVADLQNRATQLSGRNTSATDQEQLRTFFTKAADILREFR